LQYGHQVAKEYKINGLPDGIISVLKWLILSCSSKSNDGTGFPSKPVFTIGGLPKQPVKTTGKSIRIMLFILFRFLMSKR
jgi:hypothetical protein